MMKRQPPDNISLARQRAALTMPNAGGAPLANLFARFEGTNGAAGLTLALDDLYAVASFVHLHGVQSVVGDPSRVQFLVPVVPSDLVLDDATGDFHQRPALPAFPFERRPAVLVDDPFVAFRAFDAFRQAHVPGNHHGNLGIRKDSPPALGPVPVRQGQAEQEHGNPREK